MLKVIALLAGIGLGLTVLGMGAEMHVVGGFAVILAAALLLSRPTYLAAFVVSSHAWGAAGSVGGIMTPFRIGTIAFVVATILIVLRRRSVLTVPRGAIAVLVGMVALIALSELQSPAGSHWFTLLAFLSIILMFLTMTQIVRDQHGVAALAIAQSIGLVLMGWYVAREVGWDAMMSGIVRAKGPAGEANGLGAHCALALPYAIAVAISKERFWVRWIGVAGVVGAIYCQFAAASRGGTVGAIAGLLVFAWLIGERWKSRWISLGATAAGLALVLAVSPTSFDDRVVGSVRDSDSTNRDVTSSRIQQAQFASKMITERPFLGHGELGFPVAWSQRYGRGQMSALHSSMISIATAHGVPAAALYVATVVSALVLGLRATRRWRTGRVWGYALVASTVAAVVSALSLPSAFGVNVWMPLCLLYIIAHRTAEAERLGGHFGEPTPPGKVETERERAPAGPTPDAVAAP